MTHPRPQFQRRHWRSLNGPWQFSTDEQSAPEHVRYQRTITVPYAPETPRSGVHDESFHPHAWYRQSFTLAGDDQPAPDESLLLHFGAVDDCCEVWINGRRAASHEGGYTGFSIDVTPYLDGERLTVELHAQDDPLDLHKPRGKQDWLPQPHSIWYPRTTGIWQTVWLERVPTTRLHRLKWTPDMARFELTLDAHVAGSAHGLTLRTTLSVRGQVLARDTAQLHSNQLRRSIALPDPGIDDAREDLLWSPEHPQLIDATLELLSEQGTVIDRVESYAAMRSVAAEGGRFLLNGRPYPLRMVLDQGYWPEGGLSATDEELRRDVELTRQLGFNGARKHQKIEDPRYLYWCDRLGLLVWEELPSAYAFSERSAERLTRQWLRAVERDASHPCVVAWVPFNESWGVPELPRDERHRHLVRALYHLTHAVDPTRPVIGNDGWEHTISDILSIHDYTDDPTIIRDRYHDEQAVQATLTQFRPGGRRLTLDDFQLASQPVMLTEFGGIAYFTDDGDGWGYSTAADAGTFLERYTALLQAVHAASGLSGFCYTQLTDTYQEKNGLLSMNRQPKADLHALAAATLGRTGRDFDSNPLGYSRRWRLKEERHETVRR